ncbi:MAG: Subversion of eukaryotic traffic protein A [Chlamydiae bacterium]|nr:Subversion of eukaryotic traffic protein A [Chlamydiota bacterium]
MVLRRIALIFPLFFLLFGCEKKPISQSTSDDFESLMGNNYPEWRYVQTEEDKNNLAFFKQIYEENIGKLSAPNKKENIPSVLHFIWVGPKSFPLESIENVRTWIAHHPNWKVKFWTDRERPLPHPDMERVLIKESYFSRLWPYYHQSDNYGEQSDLLRLEILRAEGGIYVDHDVKCMQSFEELNKAFDLYCGMELPYPTSLSSCVLPTNNILGAVANHPIFAKTMDWLEGCWDQIEKDYPGRDRDATINRVAHRTFLVLGETFKKHANQGTCDIALPTLYFNSPKEEQALYSQHQYHGGWFENESDFEKMVRKRLMMLSKKTNKLLLAIGVLGGLNVLGWGAASVLFLRRSHV